MRLIDAYRARLDRLGFEADVAQLQAVRHLERVGRALLAAPPRQAGGLLGQAVAGLRGLGLPLPARRAQPPVRGLYLWGGTGRGKTWLMDLFFEHLPLPAKRRVHFHHLMREVHGRLEALRGTADPLEAVAEDIAAEARLLCIDEFFVEDIGDAMILAGLLRGLFGRGVTLVATSNTAPRALYRNGLQRDRFLPAIDLLEAHTEVLHLDGGIDYRFRALERAEIYHFPLDEGAEAALRRAFAELAGPGAGAPRTLQINGRALPALRVADGVAWFGFAALCEGPRAQADYIELARCYHTVLVSGVRVLGEDDEDVARRFIGLVDELYDRGVKLVCSAAAPPQGLYRGRALAFEFRRTASRLTEMQTHAYLARPHRP
ncbi:cell division protein ZapE [Inmirania thermothiophila]|nr:cell division protein ZapE [Inmirania thermothiophila]